MLVFLTSEINTRTHQKIRNMSVMFMSYNIVTTVMHRLGVQESPRVCEQYGYMLASYISVNHLSLTLGLVINSHNENITMSCFNLHLKDDTV